MRWVIALSAAAWIVIGAIVVGLWGPKAPAPRAAIMSAGPREDTALARCRLLGEAAMDDATCRAAWASARARFFGGGFEGGRS